jgi:Ca-activated chloride channel family protein
MKLDAQARLTFNTVQFDKNTDAHLVVSLKAPKIDWQAKRPRVCIIPVIDVSPSMQGQKLEYAQQSVLKLIDHLQPGDFCGIVAFGGSVAVASKPVEVTQARKDELKAKVGQLRINGSTNFSGGMCQGLELLNKGDLPDDMLKRVIMFTDGMPNTGVAITRPDIVKLLEAQLGIATLSAFGYGSDADQELLADVAKTGKGNYAFIRNPEDALSAFAKELGGLLSTFAQNLVIEVAPHNGHLITATLSDVNAEEDGNKVRVTLSDILSEEERHLVFAIKLDAQPNAFPRESSVFDVTVSYDMLDGTAQKIHQTEELKAKVQFVKADDAQAKPTPEVDRLVALAQLVQQQIKAEEMAKGGDFSGAYNALLADEDFFIPRGHGDLAAVANKMAGKMSSHGVYAANSGYLGSMKSAGTRSYGTSSLDAEASADLVGVGTQLSNEAQCQTVASFGSAVPAAGVHGVGGAGGPGVTGQGWHNSGGVPATPSMPNVVVSPSIVIQQPFVPMPPQPHRQPPVPPPAKSKVAKSKSKRW